MKNLSSAFLSFTFILGLSFSASVGWGAEPQNSFSYNSCVDMCEADFKKDPATTYEEKRDNKAACLRRCDNLKSSQDESNRVCDKAREELDKASLDFPCKESSSIKLCQDQINECAEMANSAFGAAGGDDTWSALFGTATQMLGATTNTSSTATNFKAGESCYAKNVKQNDKDILAEKKKQRERIDELKREIEKEIKNQAEDKERINKETANTEEKIQELNEELDKYIEDASAEQERVAEELSQQLRTYSSNIRTYTKNIQKSVQDIENINFSYQKEMLTFDEDTDIQCKIAGQSIAACITLVNGKPKISTDKEECKIVATAGNKGSSVKYKADAAYNLLTNKCKNSRKDEKEQKARKRLEAIKDAESNIKEGQARLKETEEDLAKKQQKFDNLPAETDAKKQKKQQKVSEKISSAQTQLQKLITVVNENIESSKKIVEDKQKEINDILAGKLADDLGIGGTIYENIGIKANDNLKKYSNAVNRANKVCCSSDQLKKENEDVCNQVNSANRTSSGSTNKKTKRPATKTPVKTNDNGG